jgi:hypothetical protein
MQSVYLLLDRQAYLKQDVPAVRRWKKDWRINMRANTFKACLRLVLFILAVGSIFLIAHLVDLGDSYGVVDYLSFSIAQWNLKRPYHHKPATSTVGDKIIVMAKMEHEDTSWVEEELPE